MIKVAIVYHYLAHYRLPIFQELMKSKEIEYTLISGTTTEINIKTINEEYKEKFINQGGLRWIFIKNKWLFRKKFLWQQGLIKLVLTSDFDAFIFLGSPYHLSSWIASILARIKGKKVYFWMHGVYRDNLKFVDLIKLKVFYKLANGYFLYGNRARTILIKSNVTSPNNIHVIYNSLDYNKSKSYNRNISIEEQIKFRDYHFKENNSPIVILIGRINEAKRIEYLIEAQFNIFSKKGNTFNIIIIGDGEERESLNILAENYNLQKNIKFVGPLYDEDEIAKYLSLSDLCVIPGDIGLTAIHSLSYGTPVISHDNLNIQGPEVEVIVEDISGNLYKYQNIEDLELKINNWFNKYPFKNKKIASNCYEIIDSKYNPGYQATIFNQVLNNIL